LADPLFAALRASVPTGFTLDDHDYGPENNADRTTMEPWVPALWQRIGADPSDLGYFDFGYEDVHCLTLDGRRYADPIDAPNTPTKTKLGAAQKSWLKRTIGTSDANLFVILSADTFASRYTVPNSPNIPDCFISGWPNEYGQLMSFFYDIQSQGRRVLIVSGDAHSLRIHYHPHPQGQPTPSPVVEFICSGIRPRRWFGAAAGDRTLDPIRNVLGRAGAGLVVIDPPAHRDRRVTVRAISGARAGPTDLFPPLILPFSSRLPDAGR
jgi:phosphodiesterase/alkaline phosphatase D-like protein